MTETRQSKVTPTTVARKLGTYGRERTSEVDGAPTRRAVAGPVIDALAAILTACEKTSGVPSEFLVELIDMHLDGKN